MPLPAEAEAADGSCKLPRRLPSLRLAAEPFEYRKTFNARGFKSLPVTF